MRFEGGDLKMPRGNKGGRGQGRGGPPGQEDYCVCPQCGKRVQHSRGTPCSQMECPKCGTRMIREGSNPQSGRGRGQGTSSGLGGNCICPECGKKVPHERGSQ